VYSGQRREETGEHFIGSQNPQQTVVLEEEEENKNKILNVCTFLDQRHAPRCTGFLVRTISTWKYAHDRNTGI
jgi:hypothetical protein